MTYSIVALETETGEIGVAVQSKVFSVGTLVPWVKADIGAYLRIFCFQISI